MCMRDMRVGRSSAACLCPADGLGRPADPAEEVDHLPQGTDGVFGAGVRAAPQYSAQRVRPAGPRRSKHRFLRHLRPRVVRNHI